MTQQSSPDALFDLWKQQIEAGTKAWTQAIGQAKATDPAQFWRPCMDQGIAAWATLMAQGPVGPDLMAQWKSFLDQWIAAWSKALEQAMGTEAFARALGQHLDQWLALQAPVRQAATAMTETTLGAMGMPSRAEVLSISRRITEVDDRLEGLDDRLGAIISRLDALSAALTPRQNGGRATRAGPPGRTSRSRRKTSK